MSLMADLHARAEVLFGHGLTKHRVLRMLRHEYPTAERDMLLRAVGFFGAPTGRDMPIWFQICGGTLCRPAFAKRPKASKL